MVKNITAEQLADKIDADEQFTLIDTRPEDSFEAWHVRDAENVPYDPDEGLSEDQLNEVNELVDGQPVVPGHVLIAPGGKQMKIVKEDRQPTICITDDPPENSCRPSADYLFRSVTRTCGPNAVGVIMTGMGNDGARGCRQMKQRGAKIIAQDEASCVVFGMPREPIEEGIADVIAPLDEIAAEIVRMVGQGAAVCR